LFRFPVASAELSLHPRVLSNNTSTSIVNTKPSKKTRKSKKNKLTKLSANTVSEIESENDPEFRPEQTALGVMESIHGVVDEMFKCGECR
jgi:hypothetical protein